MTFDQSRNLATEAVDADSHITIVVLGASGDLARKKTFPAIYNLLKYNFINPGTTHIIGYARSKLDQPEFHSRVTQNLKGKTTPSDEERLMSMCSYVSGTYDTKDGFVTLRKAIEKVEKRGKENHRLFYMALPPSVFIPCARFLKEECYQENGGWNRLIVEKPFGKDLASSRELAKALAKYWSESEIYRIDHYLGKEMVKNILTLRFANVIFSSVWNKESIDNVQITFKEPFGTEGRGGYFDEFGIVRDIMQNHLLQVLTLIAMERPVTLSSEDIRDEKVRVLRMLEPLEMENMIFGQYVASETDEKKQGYLDDPTVPKGSLTPTFAAGVFRIQNERWDGVPFIMKSGKALNEAKVEIRVQFKDIPGTLFDQPTSRNELVVRLQPGETIYVKLMNKVPGLGNDIGITEMDLSYKSRFPDARIPEAYEALILDALRGDQANFVRSDELDLAWQLFTPILHRYESEHVQPELYQYGSRGPASMNNFMARHGFVRDRTEYAWVPKGDSKYKAKTAEAPSDGRKVGPGTLGL